MNAIDTKIKNLVYFLNTLPTVKTIGSCQEHDDGGETGNFLVPYISFTCNDRRVLGFLASLRFAYEDPSEILPKYRKNQPWLRADWCIYVITGEDPEYSPEELKADNRQEDYVFYVLQPNRYSYDKPSDIYVDFSVILKYYQWKWKKMK
ncbi:MAG TPA: hypothetical protein VN377_03755 [Candidatus Thermoplasmatota archaeon]|nr:hypothetical protein [Candidatus Thermoplasmatota archaeon]